MAFQLPRRVARFNRVVTNRIQGLWAPRLAPWAEIEHRGRRSGRVYRTPVIAFRRGDTLAVVVLYGEDSDWVQNLLAAGSGVVWRGGRRYSLANVRLVSVDAAGDGVSAVARRLGRSSGTLLVGRLVG